MERGRSLRFAGVLDPELGRDEQLLTWDATAAQGSTDGLLVPVGGGGVNEPVPDLEGRGDRLLGVLRRDLVDAEAETGIATPLFSVTLGIVMVTRTLLGSLARSEPDVYPDLALVSRQSGSD